MPLESNQAEAGKNEVVWEIAPDETRQRNSEGAFLKLKGGSIIFVYTRFYGGQRDDSAANLECIRSDDGGYTWSWPPKVIVQNEGQANVMCVSLLRLRDGEDDNRIALVYLIKNGTYHCRPLIRFSDDEAITWSAPHPIIPEQDSLPEGHDWFTVNNDRVIQLSSGRIIMPVAYKPTDGTTELSTPWSTRWYLSDDLGQTWREAQTHVLAEDSNVRGLQEPGVVELSNGSLLSWMRTDQGCQYSAWSVDEGENWSEAQPWTLSSPLSPATIKRLPGSADLLAIFNDHSGVFPIPEKAYPENPNSHDRRRTPLVAAVSSDDGQSWPLRRLLESNPAGFYCYTALEFVEDAVLLAYSVGTYGPPRATWGRQRIRLIRLSTLTERGAHLTRVA